MLSKIEALKHEISNVIVGHSELINSLIIGLMCKGHILIEGVPGVAKTTTINTLAKTLGLTFGRIQFTPDLLPSDIIGMEIFNPKLQEFSTKKGPIFKNIVLADEINRAPAKVQSALLEAMQEKQITIGEHSYLLPSPFFVLATQNPIESGGTYSLPEAQLDRFMMKLILSYNTKEEEKEIIRRASASLMHSVATIFTHEDLEELFEVIQHIHIDPEVEEYLVDIVFATREPLSYNLTSIAPLIRFGVSPRSSMDLHRASKAYAFLQGRDYVTPVDIASVCKNVMRHRLILTYEAEAQGVIADDIINTILATLPLP